MNAMADTEFFREPIDLPTEVVFLYFARLFAFVVAAACVAMGAFCVYASVAQLLFLRAMRGIWGPGGVRAMTVVLLLHQAYCVFLGGMPGLIGWRDIETGADLRNSIVLLVWAVLWSVVLLVKLLRCSPRATSTPSPAEKTHAETAESAEPEPHAEGAEQPLTSNP